jgi:predicted alpha-1,2-mannosidase
MRDVATGTALLAAAVSFNPWIGTGGFPHTSGMTSPAATLPFGWVRLGPDTLASQGIMSQISASGRASAGYSWDDDRVLGFSHTRLVGTGARDGGVFRVLPAADPQIHWAKTPGQKLRHDQERAEPGYYSISFPDEGIRAELAASVHCGFHRYHRDPARGPLHLLLDATSDLWRVKNAHPDARVSIDRAARTIDGQVTSQGVFSSRQGGLTLYFHAEYSGTATGARIWKDKSWLPDASQAAGDSIGVALSSPASPGSGDLELKLCISAVSVANARLNFDAEARAATFDSARQQAALSWDEYFNRARIQSSDPELMTLYRTMLYYSALLPTHFSDVNGDYLGFDRKIRRATGFIYRTDMSLWDTFRTVHPLMTLIAPETQRDSLLSLLSMSETTGVFPRWPFGAADSGSMFGSPANFLFSESYSKGIRGFDVARALAVMHRGSTASDADREPECRRLGWCPSDSVGGSVSKTLEYAWSDFAAAELAAAAGDAGLESLFRELSRRYRNTWDPDTRFFRPRDSAGRFIKFNPNVSSYLASLDKSARNYVEGSGHEWRWSVAHDPQDLIALMGGPARFTADLEDFLEGASIKRGAIFPGAKYWHGNEHDIHSIYLFDEAGRPELTQKWVRWALSDRYANSPDGLDGNDDAGTLSAWYVLSSLGIYPQPGTDRYWIGSPAVEGASLRLGSSDVLSIEVRNQSPKNVYVQSLTVNGAPWCRPWIRHAELRNATLVFVLGPGPATGGGLACRQS